MIGLDSLSGQILFVFLPTTPILEQFLKRLNSFWEHLIQLIRAQTPNCKFFLTFHGTLLPKGNAKTFLFGLCQLVHFPPSRMSGSIIPRACMHSYYSGLTNWICVDRWSTLKLATKRFMGVSLLSIPFCFTSSKSYVEVYLSIIINQNGRLIYQKLQKMEWMSLQNNAVHFPEIFLKILSNAGFNRL